MHKKKKKDERDAYIEKTVLSAGLQVIPVQLQGMSSESSQLLRKFLVSFKVVLSSSNVIPTNQIGEPKTLVL